MLFGAVGTFLGQYIFWPDLASSHYARATLNLFESEDILYVPRFANPPPSVQQCRPIEEFWAILKAKVYDGNWETTTDRQLRQRINKCWAG